MFSQNRVGWGFQVFEYLVYMLVFVSLLRDEHFEDCGYEQIACAAKCFSSIENPRLAQELMETTSRIIWIFL